MNFSYTISQKEGLVVVSFKGDLDEIEGPKLKKCLEDVATLSPLGVVLHWAESGITKEGFREFSIFLREVKVKCGVVKLSALNSRTVDALKLAGLLTGAELRETLIDALKEVAAQIKVNKV